MMHWKYALKIFGKQKNKKDAAQLVMTVLKILSLFKQKKKIKDKVKI